MWKIQKRKLDGWETLGGSYASYGNAQWELDQIEPDTKSRRTQYRIVRDPIYNL